MTSATYEQLSKEQLIKLLLERDIDVEANPHKKKYGLIWENKPEQFEADSVGKISVLKRDPAKSIVSSPDGPTHVLIQGDNYHALKVLAYTHERSVDVIYIDSPYNTGNKDFKYNDKFVDKEDGYRHSKWLSFMAKRLRLAKTLLKDTGAIFLSIDDNEQAQLKLLCDEIFGQDNFIANIVLKKGRGSQDALHLKIVHEYALMYAKNKSKLRVARNSRTREATTSVSLRKTGEGDRKADAPALHYPIYADPSSGRIELEPFNGAVEILPVGPGGYESRWRWGKEKFRRENHLLTLAKTRKGTYDLQSRYAEGSTAVEPFNALLVDFGAPGGTQLNDILPGNGFKNPKHTVFVAHLLSMIEGDDLVVLDFFAGSGTTAHAVMQLNAEDGGTRQCILVTNDEGEFQDEQGNLLDGGICTHVTYPRLTKVIEGYTTPKGKQVAGLAENLVFFDTEFVEDRALERSRRELTARSAEMLCLRELTFIEEESTDKRWRCFTDGHGKRLVVVTDAFAANDLRPLLKADKRETLVYVFRFGDDEDPAREYVGKGLEHITAKPVPDSLLALHRRIQRQEAA